MAKGTCVGVIKERIYTQRPSGLLVRVQRSPKRPQKSERESGGSQLVRRCEDMSHSGAEVAAGPTSEQDSDP